MSIKVAVPKNYTYITRSGETFYRIPKGTIHRWLEDNVGDQYNIELQEYINYGQDSLPIIEFQNENDAVLFKLEML